MANERILAVGRIEAGGDVQWRISPVVSDDALSDAELAEMHAYEAEMAFRYRGVAHGPQAMAQMQDGPLQRLIDYGAELQELEDDMDDREFWASGNW